MPFSITTQDGITINNIPDNIDPKSDQLRQRVAEIRAQGAEQQPVAQAEQDQTQAEPGIAERATNVFNQATTRALANTLGLPLEAVASALDLVGVDTPFRPSQILRGPVELATNIAQTLPAEAIGGVAGTVQAFNPLAQEGAGAAAVEAVTGVVPPLGEAGTELIQDIAGVIPEPIKEAGRFVSEQFGRSEQQVLEKFGPVAATALTLLPDIALIEIPGSSALKKARNIPTTIADDVVDEAGDAARNKGAQGIKTEIPPEAKDYQQVADDLRNQKTQRAAQAVKPDTEILASAEALGVDLNPSHYSTNRAFIDVEQSLKDLPGSKLAGVEEKAIIDTGNAADKLIDDLGGQTDKSILDLNVKNDIETKRLSLENKSDQLYGKIAKTIPAATKVTPTASREYINRTLAEFGGDKTLLTASEKQLLRLADDINNPTYAALDRMRKDVGNALGKRKGPYVDEDTSTLKQLFKVLSEDQQGVADAFGVGSEYGAARKLVATRKTLEDRAMTLFGREINKSIIPQLKTSATALKQGDISNFKKLMSALPASRRTEAAATMLNNLFTSGARKGGTLGGGFMSAFQSLNRNAGAKKELFKHLPKGAQKRFNDIGRVTTGIFRAKALENKSKTAKAVVNAMNDAGLLGKLYGVSKIAGKTPVVGPTAGNILGTILSRVTPSTQAADNFVTSPSFKSAVVSAVEGNAARSESVLSKSKPFQKWLTTQPPAIQKEIASIGFVTWLTQEED